MTVSELITGLEDDCGIIFFVTEVLGLFAANGFTLSELVPAHEIDGSVIGRD